MDVGARRGPRRDRGRNRGRRLDRSCSGGRSRDRRCSGGRSRGGDRGRSGCDRGRGGNLGRGNASGYDHGRDRESSSDSNSRGHFGFERSRDHPYPIANDIVMVQFDDGEPEIIFRGEVKYTCKRTSRQHIHLYAEHCGNGMLKTKKYEVFTRENGEEYMQLMSEITLRPEDFYVSS